MTDQPLASRSLGPDPSPVGGPEAPLRVLVADDSAVTRRVLSALISTILPGAQLVEAANGGKTCDALRAEAFDVAFVDVHMPDMSGPRAISRVRQSGISPFVVLMGDSQDDLADPLVRDIEAYEFLQKPLEEQELRQIFANVRRMREPTRALIVDDSKASRRLMSKVLEASRFTINIAAADSGESALALLKEEPYDVLFLDYAMPGIDGLETACLVQELMPDVRVVMVSASQNPAVEKAARYFGAIHFMRKPFYAREVDKVMHLALDLRLTSFMLEPEEEKPPHIQLELALFAE